MIHDVQDANFDAVVENSDIPVLVEFWQLGCGPCQALLSQLENVQAVLGRRVLIVKMNVQDNFQIPADLEIQSLPVLALFHHGEFIQFVGGIGAAPELITQLISCLQMLDS